MKIDNPLLKKNKKISIKNIVNNFSQNKNINSSIPLTKN